MLNYLLSSLASFAFFLSIYRDDEMTGPDGARQPISWALCPGYLTLDSNNSDEETHTHARHHQSEPNNNNGEKKLAANQ